MMIEVFLEEQSHKSKREVGEVHLLLMEGRAKREEGVLMGKTDNFQNGYVKVQEVPLFEGGMIVGSR